MDIIPKLKYLIFLLLFIPTLAFSQAAPTGYVDLAGWVKGVDGTYSRAFEGANRTAPLASSLKVISDAGVSTSKGYFTIPVEKTAIVATSRLGSAVVGLAKKVGPLGMALSAASLVCELSNICVIDGKWNIGYVNETMPSGSTQWSCSGFGIKTLTDCKTSIHQCYTGTYTCFNDSVASNGLSYTFQKKYTSDGQLIGTVTLTRTTAWTPTQNPGSAPIDTDWSTAATKLNDDRFVPELIDKQADIPTGLPTITNTPKATISQDTSVTKDANGNATGTKVTTTEAEIVDAATAESPGKAIVKETTTVTNYDINNTVINSTTSTSYTSQPPPNNPADQITISFDDVPDSGIEQQDVDADLQTPESWGDGFCPADKTIDYHYGTLTYDFQPTCDFAIEVKPVLLFIASITAMFIISGVKVE